MSDPQIKRVLVSVTDKTGVAEFARALADEFGAEIISTGGTARALKEAGVRSFYLRFTLEDADATAHVLDEVLGQLA